MLTARSTNTSEALLARLNELFTQDPAIDEIGLLFSIEADDLTVETAFVLEEHKLGVAFSAGPLVFQAARTRFHFLNAQLHTGDMEEGAREELLTTTRAVLLISADFYTAWNTRKEYVRRGWLDASNEVAFTNLVFSLHPKSIDTWAYRRWLATRLCEQLTTDETERDLFFQAQVDLCALLAERFPRNYHAWSFRHWLVSQCTPAQLERELLAMHKWCEMHLKDHSGWNHRQHTLRCLLTARAPQQPAQQQLMPRELLQQKELLVSEYEFVSTITARHPQYEALWCHRRFVMQNLLLLEDKKMVSSPASDTNALEKTISDALAAVVSCNGESTTSDDTEWLITEFGHVRESLVDQGTLLLDCAVRDLVVVWRCGNRFARRYALWLLERVRGLSSVKSSTLVEPLNRLNLAMRAALATQDPLLDHLWRA